MFGAGLARRLSARRSTTHPYRCQSSSPYDPFRRIVGRMAWFSRFSGLIIYNEANGNWIQPTGTLYMKRAKNQLAGGVVDSGDFRGGKGAIVHPGIIHPSREIIADVHLGAEIQVCGGNKAPAETGSRRARQLPVDIQGNLCGASGHPVNDKGQVVPRPDYARRGATRRGRTIEIHVRPVVWENDVRSGSSAPLMIQHRVIRRIAVVDP